MTAIEPTQSGHPEHNWAGNHTYAGRVIRPESIEALQDLVARSTKVGFLGSRHSFNAIADSELLLDMRSLPQEIAVNRDRGSVTVSGAITYGALAPVLEQHGLALANLASLPHISVAGAISTGTHGSGARLGSLATAVSALELAGADGELKRVARGDAEFNGYVVGVGALGAIVRVELDVEPTYEVAQTVTEHVPWSGILADLQAVMASSYSLSLFTWWEDDEVSQAWAKARIGDGRAPLELPGGTPATHEMHPLGPLDAVNCTPQLGVPGPWFERLPHFRLGFTPSNGDEVQSEYLLDRDNATVAIEAMRRIGPSIRPALLVCEVRTIAADDLWLSPAYGRDSIAFHFTWRLDSAAIDAALALIEAALMPLGARPHWGKVFLAGRQDLIGRYPRWDEFVELATGLDPQGKFRNDWLDTHIFG